MERASTTFDWGVYADATFAGLSALIPIPLVDLLFEQFFRRRMATSIARQQGRHLSPEVNRVFNRSGCSAQSCLLFLPWLTFKVLKRLSQKILYFLAVKEATDLLSYYWHRAFLLDYMLSVGHLDSVTTAETARRAMDRTMTTTRISPMRQVAQEVVRQSHHILRTLWRVIRRKGEDEVVAQDRATLKAAWNDIQGYLDEVAEHYHQTYDALRKDIVAEQQAATQ